MKKHVLGLDAPLGKILMPASFNADLSEDLYDYFDDLEKRIPGEDGRAKKVVDVFHYNRIIHIKNFKHVTFIFNTFLQLLSDRQHAKTLRLGFRRKDIMSIVMKIDFGQVGIPQVLPGLAEMERFRIKAAKYPVTVTFRTVVDSVDIDLEVVVTTAGWHFPGFGTLLYREDLFTVETDTPCIMYSSTIIHGDSYYGVEEIKEMCENRLYRNGFRHSIDFGSMIEDSILKSPAPVPEEDIKE